jgi:hypothetical protein
MEKVNMIDKPLGKLCKREKTQINETRDENGDITTDTMEIPESLEYFENVCSKKLENMEKWINFYTRDLPVELRRY